VENEAETDIINNGKFIANLNTTTDSISKTFADANSTIRTKN
jgi:hypothetical protein